MAQEAVVLINADATNFYAVMENLKKESRAAANSIDKILSTSFSKINDAAMQASNALERGIVASLVTVGTSSSKLQPLIEGLETFNTVVGAGSTVIGIMADLVTLAEVAQRGHASALATSAIATGAQAAATTAATGAQIALNVAMGANIVGLVAIGIMGLVGALEFLTGAFEAVFPKQESLTASSQAQKDKVSELQAEYDKIVASQDANSEAALTAKEALDKETAAFEASKQTIPEFVAECEDLRAKHTSLVDELDKGIEAADSQAESMIHLATELESLAGLENKSAADKARMQAIVNQLNASNEDLNLVYDAQNDSLSMTPDLIKKLATAEGERLQYTSQMEKIGKLYEEQSTLTGQLEEAEANLAAATEEAADSQGIFGNSAPTKEMKDLEAQIEGLNSDISRNSSEIDLAAEKAAAAYEHETALASAMQEVAAGANLGATARKYNLEVSELSERANQAEEEALAELAKQYEEAATALDDYTAKNPAFLSAMEAAGFSSEALGKKLVDSGIDVGEFTQKFDDCVKDVTSGLDVLDVNSQISLEKLMENLKANAEATTNWKNNCKTVWDSIAPELRPAIQGMIEAGPEQFARVMQELAGLNAEQMTEYLTNMKGYTDSATQAGTDAVMRTTGVGNSVAENLNIPPGSLSPEAMKQWVDDCEAVLERIGPALEPAVQSLIDAGPHQFASVMDELAGMNAEQIETFLTDMGVFTEASIEALSNTELVASGFGERIAESIRLPEGSLDSEALMIFLSDLLAMTDSYGVVLADNLRLPEGSLNYHAIGDALLSAGFTAAEIANMDSIMIAQALGISPEELDMTALSMVVQNEGARAAEDANAKGTTTGGNYTNSTAIGIASGQSQVTTAATSTLSAAVNSAVPIASSGGIRIGQSLAQGIASGIGSNSSSIISAATSAVSNAIAAAKAAGEIRSPSKRTEREIGSQLIAGAVLGITKNAESFSGAMTNAMEMASAEASQTTRKADFMQLLATNIRSKISEVRAAASEAAAAMSNEFENEHTLRLQAKIGSAREASNLIATQLTTTASAADNAQGNQYLFNGDIILRAEDIEDVNTFTEFGQRLTRYARAI